MHDGRVVILLVLRLGAVQLWPAEARAEADWAQDDRVARLSEALRSSGSFKARATAAVALGRLGDARAASPLAEALRGDEHYAVRVAAASALGYLPTTDAVQPLLGALHDQDPFVREEAEGALARFHTPERVAAFNEALRSPDTATRRAAVRAYAAVVTRAPAAGSFVVAALGDDDDDIRAVAARSLEAMPRASAVPLVAEGLRNGGSEVRAACARAARGMADTGLVEPLTALLVSNDDSEDARAAARAALKAHVAFLDKALLQALARDIAPERRDERVRALRVLAAIDDALAPALAEQALTDPDASVRVGGARAAAELGGGRGRRLLEAARDREVDVRTQKQLELILKIAR